MKQITVIFIVFLLAFSILYISVLRTAEIKYSFSGFAGNPMSSANIQEGSLHVDSKINYILPKPGSVLPDNLLWPVKAMRDKTWSVLTTSTTKRAELHLLFADKRLVASRILLEKGNYDLAVATLTKAEKHLEEASTTEMKARSKGLDTSKLLVTLANASLKHREVIEEMIPLFPEGARSAVIKVEDYPKKAYEEAMHALQEKKLFVPPNPFIKD